MSWGSHGGSDRGFEEWCVECPTRLGRSAFASCRVVISGPLGGRSRGLARPDRGPVGASVCSIAMLFPGGISKYVGVFGGVY